MWWLSSCAENACLEGASYECSELAGDDGGCAAYVPGGAACDADVLYCCDECGAVNVTACDRELKPANASDEVDGSILQ
jgi:hypothetical protein